MSLKIPKEKPKSVSEPIQKGNATLVIRMKNVQWQEIVDVVSHLTKNPTGWVVEVYIGNEVFDA